MKKIRNRWGKTRSAPKARLRKTRKSFHKIIDSDTHKTDLRIIFSIYVLHSNLHIELSLCFIKISY